MIRMIVLPDCPKSQYYSKICVERWEELGYNISLFEGTTPDTLGNRLDFAEKKTTGKPFTPTRESDMVQSLSTVGNCGRTDLHY